MSHTVERVCKNDKGETCKCTMTAEDKIESIQEAKEKTVGTIAGEFRMKRLINGGPLPKTFGIETVTLTVDADLLKEKVEPTALILDLTTEIKEAIAPLFEGDEDEND